MHKKLTTKEFIEKAKKIHGDKYDYSKSNYLKTSTRLIITCNLHGDFKQTPNKHLMGRGCPLCANISRSKKSKKYTLEEFIERAKQVHGDKYDYSKSIYINNSTKVLITCPIHGDFYQIPTSHINNKQGCPKCGLIKRNISQSLTLNEFINKAKEIHGNKYDYSKSIYVNEHTKLKIICPIHGEFEQLPIKHLNNHGCPKCNSSHLENVIRNLLNDNNIKFEEQKSWDWLFYKNKQYSDFYLLDYNIVIECQGKQHFEKSKFFNKDCSLKGIQDRDKNKKRIM